MIFSAEQKEENFWGDKNILGIIRQANVGVKDVLGVRLKEPVVIFIVNTRPAVG